MKELIDKISSYNIFNYLLPGTLFSVLAERFTNYKIVQGDIIVDLFIYYFMGLIISRIGSLFLKPILVKAKLLKFSPYQDFLNASKNDAKIELLSEMNNMYRTLFSLFFVLFGVKIYSLAEQKFAITQECSWSLIFVFLFVLFLLSFRKQTQYINDRIKANNKKNQEGK